MELASTGSKVHLVDTDVRCLSDELVSDVTKDVDGDTDVVGDEVGVVERGVHERVETLEEAQDASEHKCEPSGIRLEGGFVREGITRDPLGLHSSHECDVRREDRDPSETAENRDGRSKVAKDLESVG